jgi:hypothetical protein
MSIVPFSGLVLPCQEPKARSGSQTVILSIDRTLAKVAVTGGRNGRIYAMGNTGNLHGG